MRQFCCPQLIATFALIACVATAAVTLGDTSFSSPAVPSLDANASETSDLTTESGVAIDGEGWEETAIVLVRVSGSTVASLRPRPTPPGVRPRPRRR